MSWLKAHKQQPKCQSKANTSFPCLLWNGEERQNRLGPSAWARHHPTRNRVAAKNANKTTKSKIVDVEQLEISGPTVEISNIVNPTGARKKKSPV